MTQRELLYIKTILEEQSISGAARKLYIAQPSLSQCLQRLEESLGTPLFRRTTSGLLPTFAGERYYLLANKILKMYEDFEIEISDINNMKTGRIHIGITNHLAVHVLPQILPEFRNICPNIDIHISEKNSTELEEAIINGTIDFAIMHVSQQSAKPQINYEYLLTDPFLLATAPDHPLATCSTPNPGYPYPNIDLQLFKEEPFIMLSKQQRIRQITDVILEHAQIKPNIILTLKNFETAKRLAYSGMGITMIPLQYTQIFTHEMSPAYYYVNDSYQSSWDLCIATMKNSFLSKADQLLFRIIRKHYFNVI